jgi:hypothetical protein
MGTGESGPAEFAGARVMEQTQTGWGMGEIKKRFLFSLWRRVAARRAPRSRIRSLVARPCL